MFTGIVEEKGSVRYMQLTGESGVLAVKAKKVLERTKIGDSIAVNGICLTVTALRPGIFTADVMHETLNRSAMASLTSGSHVNLERAMQPNGRFGGHMVAGHIDGTGKVVCIQKDDIAVWFTIQTKPEIMRYIVPHTVDLLVVVEVAGLVKGRADDHGLLRLLRQQQVALDGVPVQEVLHAEGQLPAAGDMAEHQRMALAAAGGISGGGGLRQARPAHGKGPHGAAGHLPPLIKLQKGDGVQPHVAVVGNGQRHGKMVVGHKVVVPLLDAGGRSLDVRPAIDGQQALGVARLPEIALFVQKRCAGGDLMLHGGVLLLDKVRIIV